MVIEEESFCGIRLFASRGPDGTAAADCRINGMDWLAGKEALLKYVASWPDAGFEFRKQFVAIRSLGGGRDGEAPIPLRGRLLQALAAPGPAAQGSDEEIVVHLINQGYSAHEAALFVALVPIAFSRPVLEDLGIAEFPSNFAVKNRRSQWIEVPFAEQPFYLAALAIAREQRRTGRLINQDVYTALTLRCAAINAVSKALNEGVDLKGGRISDYAVNGIRAEDLVPASDWLNRVKRSLWGPKT